MARTFPCPRFCEEESSVSRWLYLNRRQYPPVRKESERGTVTHELEAQRAYFEEIVPAQQEKRWLD